MSAHAVDEAVRPSCRSTSFTLPFLNIGLPLPIQSDRQSCMSSTGAMITPVLTYEPTRWFKKNEGFSDIVPIERKHEVI